VRAVLDALRLASGDIAAVNDPFAGGTHLPDITMVAPYYGSDPERPLFYSANRAHHSDIGGMSPGSMPLATEIFQEGLRIPPIRFARGGRVDDDLLAMILANVRTPRERSGDLRAQIASLDVGLSRVAQMCATYGEAAVQERAGELHAYAERGTRALLATLPPGVYEFEDALEDDGFGSGPLAIRVRVTLRDHEAIVDFTGTAPQTAGPVNAVEAITRSAVLYAFRCLLPGEVPANDGCFVPIRLIAPPGTIVNANPPAAVAAGNVETSQRIVDVVFGALARAIPDRIPAASAGTMNNVAIGGVHPATGDAFAYYETLGGGMGGRPGGDGLSAVHTHMTNSLNTPIEAIEHDLPVTIRRYAIRAGSGGDGLRRGGDGLVREYEFLAPAEVTVLAERRSLRPWGAAGGGAAEPGRDTLVRLGSGEERMPGKFRARVLPGDVLIVETPGGGGWGRRKP